MAGQAGIFYVNSKITSPTLTHDVFTRWYEDVHVPDILITSGINAAFRYKATGPVDRPYLALYPVRDVGWLSSDEFKSIPVHSDLLPNESRAIFEIADFDARNYASRGRRGGGGIQGRPPPFIFRILPSPISPFPFYFCFYLFYFIETHLQ